MRRLTLKLTVTLLAFFTGVTVFYLWDGVKRFPKAIQTRLNSTHCADSRLRLSTQSTAVRVGEEPSVRVSITNNSNKTISLVNPGDGSESGWRTPVITWSIIEGTGQHPSDPVPLSGVRRCGNINSLQWNEVFRLAPGETKELGGWVYLAPFRNPGVYRVVFLYANRPSLEWSGIPLGVHNPLAMWRVGHSTECSLVSNEVVFTVTE